MSAIKVTKSSVATEAARPHVRVWQGSRSARITDMSYAGKRGKRCATFHFSGCDGCVNLAHAGNRIAADATCAVLARLQELDKSAEPISYADVCQAVRSMVNEALAQGANPYYLRVYDDDIRAVDAPKPILEAGVEGVWRGTADAGGIRLADDSDKNNEPRAITSGQSNNVAYKIAARTWGRSERSQDDV
jgi:hypothetical protein